MSHSAESPSPIEALPEPHTCPFWMQYVLLNPLRRLLEPPSKVLGPYVEPGMTVVDPGCGFGFFSLPLARMVGPTGRVVCVDIEPRAVARLERRARRSGLEGRIDARVCEQGDLGLGEYRGRVDLVAVCHTLHEFQDLKGFLDQAAQLLRSDGRLLVVEPRGHLEAEAFAAEIACCCQEGFRRQPLAVARPFVALLAPPVRQDSAINGSAQPGS